MQAFKCVHGEGSANKSGVIDVKAIVRICNKEGDKLTADEVKATLMAIGGKPAKEEGHLLLEEGFFLEWIEEMFGEVTSEEGEHSTCQQARRPAQ